MSISKPYNSPAITNSSAHDLIEKLSHFNHTVEAAAFLASSLNIVGLITYLLHFELSLHPVHIVCGFNSLLLISVPKLIAKYRYYKDKFRLFLKWVNWGKKIPEAKYGFQYFSRENIKSDCAFAAQLCEGFIAEKVEIWQLEEIFFRLFQRNQKGIRVLTINSIPFGIICIIPLLNKKHYYGKIGISGLSPKMISQGRSNMLLMPGIFIDPRYNSEKSLDFWKANYEEMASKLMESSKAKLYTLPKSVCNIEVLRTLNYYFVERLNQQTSFMELRVKKAAKAEGMSANSILKKFMNTK